MTLSNQKAVVAVVEDAVIENVIGQLPEATDPCGGEMFDGPLGGAVGSEIPAD